MEDNDLIKIVGNFEESIKSYFEGEAIDECQSFKLAYLVGTDPFKFEALFGGTWGVEEKFVCPKGHAKPDIFCSCGFHSFKDFKQAVKERFYFRKTFLIHVENFGQIVEHEKGFRSEEQVVKKIIVPERCMKGLCYFKTYAIVKGLNVYETSCKIHYNVASRHSSNTILLSNFYLYPVLKLHIKD